MTAEMLQPTLDSCGEPLSQTTFVVVDLETTGGSPRDCAITEIGAVKVRGGEVLGEFQTLVDPGMPIPPMIVVLTGITDAMVINAPPIAEVLPAFLEFLGDSVLVAHNARFDTGFLKEACRRHDYPWPRPQVVDTVLLARRATTKEEAPNKKLSTLARVFGTHVTPNHRALEDARATAEILHKMLERLAAHGITHRPDLAALRNPAPETIRRKASMADAVPAKPGVYTFVGSRGERLYVGTSKNLRSRVKSYFTNGEQRRAIRDMLELAVRVETVVCATEVEANVLEVRLIHQHRPRFNRRSARPERTPWIKLTDEAYPRLSVTRGDGLAAGGIGPMRNGKSAQAAQELLSATLNLRTCTTRLPIAARSDARACLLKDLGQCAAPCVRGAAAGYDTAVSAAQKALGADLEATVSVVETAIGERSASLEYERAADLRDGLAAVIDGAMRASRLRSLQECTLVAAKRNGPGWDLACVSRGVLVGSSHATVGVWAHARALMAKAAALDEPSASTEERELVVSWLESPGTRLLFVEGDWTSQITGPARFRQWVSATGLDRAHMAHAQATSW